MRDNRLWIKILSENIQYNVVFRDIFMIYSCCDL